MFQEVIMDDTGMLEKIRAYLLDRCNLELFVYEHPPDSCSMPEYQEDYCRFVCVRAEIKHAK